MHTYTISPFEGLDENIRQEIDHFTKLVYFKKGETLFTNNELSHYFYVVQNTEMTIHM